MRRAQKHPRFSAAVEQDLKDVPAKRPVPMIPPGEPIAERTVWHGFFKRRKPDAFPGAAMASDMGGASSVLAQGFDSSVCVRDFR